MYIQKANSQAQYLTCQYCLHGFYPQTMQTQMEVKRRDNVKNITVFYLCTEKTSSTETLIQWQTENKTFKCLRL